VEKLKTGVSITMETMTVFANKSSSSPN